VKKDPKELTAKQLSNLSMLDGQLAELYEAQCNGTLKDKLFENSLYKVRVPSLPRRTLNPSAGEIFDERINRTVNIAGKKMRRIEAKIIRLVALAVDGDMSAAERLADMRARSKRHGDFQLEEEFDRYAAKTKKRAGGK